MNPLGLLILIIIILPFISLVIGWAVTPVCLCGKPMDEVNSDIADTNKYYCKSCKYVTYR